MEFLRCFSGFCTFFHIAVVFWAFVATNPVFSTPNCGDAISCQNFGTCVKDTKNGFTCRCPAGFVGALCQFPDPCLASQCQNGATCSVFFDGATATHGHNPPSFNCTCPPGFTAPLCEIALPNVCDKKPCKNGATCQLLWTPSSTNRSKASAAWPALLSSMGDNPGKGDRFSCICPPGYKGATCSEISTNQCPHGKNCTTARGSSSIQQKRAKKDNYEACEKNNLCKNGGFCAKNKSATQTCECPENWRGEFCTTDIDECQETQNLCQNGGTCSNHPGGFRCICVNGWLGDHCEINHNDCDGTKCYNGGTCHDRVAAFHCECAVGFTGLLCHLRDACMSSPCHAESVCDTSPVDGTYACSCPQGYKGTDCSDDVDECSLGNPCEHGGKCVNTPGSYRCQCTIGWTGMFCDQNVNECTSDPCMNQATCLDDVGKFICVCMPGFSGIFCEKNVDDCASKPCQNNGFCVDGTNSYTCRCSPGYYGKHCEHSLVKPDLCASKPCKNNGECVELTGHYICRCSDDFYGIHCEREIVTKRPTTARSFFTTPRPAVTAPAPRRPLATSVPRISDPVDFVSYTEMDKVNLARCLAHQCAKKSNNGICDPECNFPICGYDGLDCSAGLDPFAHCKAKDLCPHVFKDGKCNEDCNTESCLFDGFDCINKTDSTCNPLYKTYCIRHLGDGNCDSGCNTRGCNYDGGDCVAKKEHRAVLVGAVALVLTVDPDVFAGQLNDFLMALGKILDVNLKIKMDDKGRPMIYRWNSRDGVESDEPIPLPDSKEISSNRKSTSKDRNLQIFSGVFVVLTVDVTKCETDGRLDCFSKVENVANFLGASRAREALKQQLGWDIYSATPEQDRLESGWARNVWIASLAALLVMVFFLLVVLQRKRKIISKLWNIPGSSLVSGRAMGGVRCPAALAREGDDRSMTSSTYCCNAVDAATPRRATQNLYVDADVQKCKADAVGSRRCGFTDTGDKRFKHPYSHLEEYLTSNCQHQQLPREIMDVDQYSESGTHSTYACDSDLAACCNQQQMKKFKPSTASPSGHVILSADHRQQSASNQYQQSTNDWQMEHKAAAGLMNPGAKIFPSSVNVKGPDDQTPVMVSAYTGFDTDETIKMLEQLIACGADLNEQTRTHGDTALSLGVKCCRVQAVKTMLQRGADPNAQDMSGNCALHHAVNANSAETLACILQHSRIQLDIELRNEEAATPLILAAKQAAGSSKCMELLLLHKASSAAQDNEGKTALHWCALQNDVEGINCLLNYGANKDSTNQNEQTPIFLAVREGHVEATLALLERGASKEMVDDMERSPLQLAQERGYEQLALILCKWQNFPKLYSNGHHANGCNNAEDALHRAISTSGLDAASLQAMSNVACLNGGNDDMHGMQFSSATLRHNGQYNKPKPPKRTKSLRAPAQNRDGHFPPETGIADRTLASIKRQKMCSAAPNRQKNAGTAKNRTTAKNGSELVNNESSSSASSSSLTNHKSPMSTDGSSSSSGYGSASSSSHGAMSDASPALSLESPPFYGGTPSPLSSTAPIVGSGGTAGGIFSPSQPATVHPVPCGLTSASAYGPSNTATAVPCDTNGQTYPSSCQYQPQMAHKTALLSPQNSYVQQQHQQWYNIAADDFDRSPCESDNSTVCPQQQVNAQFLQQTATVCQQQPAACQQQIDAGPPYWYPAGNVGVGLAGGYTHYTTPPTDLQGTCEFVDERVVGQREYGQMYCNNNSNFLQAQTVFYGN